MKSRALILLTLTALSCQKEDAPADLLLGRWESVSTRVATTAAGQLVSDTTIPLSGSLEFMASGELRTTPAIPGATYTRNGTALYLDYGTSHYEVTIQELTAYKLVYQHSYLPNELVSLGPWASTISHTYQR